VARQIKGYLAALGAVAIVTGLIALVLGSVRVANISMLYLVAVLATAIAFGRGPAVLASVVAFLTFNFLFVYPVGSFLVADPEEWIALLLFLVTAVAASHLAAEERRRRREAEEHEREALLLYDLVGRLGAPDLPGSLRAVANGLGRALDLDAVTIEIDDPTLGRLNAVVGDGADAGRDQLLMIPIAEHGRRIGALRIVSPTDWSTVPPSTHRLLGAVADQIAIAVERARLRQEATENEILRRTDDLKSALINAVSHDVRTPLASIMTAAGGLRQRDGDWSDEERAELVETIEAEASRLNRIFGNLLDLSRMEGGSLRPVKEWHDVGTIVADALARLRSVTARHPITIDVPDDLPPVLLDPVEIDQVLTNLIENAVKYTPPGTPIEVHAAVVDGELRLEVADRGPGIASVDLPHLFDPFYRTGGTRRPMPKGLGLGLAIARGLIEAHGGRLRAENRLGGGARFVATIPAGAPAVLVEG
jgi:two-component system sensor histidine kinase KdpD